MHAALGPGVLFCQRDMRCHYVSSFLGPRSNAKGVSVTNVQHR